jgi:4-coumarate--CoA ligase
VNFHVGRIFSLKNKVNSNLMIQIQLLFYVSPLEQRVLVFKNSLRLGLPKAVMLSHRNVVAAVLQFADIEGRYLTHQDVFCGVLPFYHIGGLAFTLLLSFVIGLQVVVMRRFDLAKWLETIQTYRVTYAHVAPPISISFYISNLVVLLAKDPIVDKYDLSSLRVINSAAAPLKADLLVAAYKRLGIPIKQGYGMTETSPMGCTPLWEDWKLYGTIGRVGALMEYKVIDAEGNEIPRDQVGEICLRGPNIMLGYLNNEKATKDAFTEDGFLKTGDIGYVGENENFWITDRVKELIKVKGFQVAPAELEDILMNHPAIVDVGVSRHWSDEEMTEHPKAYVVLEAKYFPSDEMEADIRKWFSQKVVHYKQLRGGVVFIEAVPKTASGKVTSALNNELTVRSFDEI